MQNYYGPMYPNNGYQLNGYPTMNANLQQPQQTSQAPQIQNAGFLAAPNEDFVMNYPVGPGNCLTFKIEGRLKMSAPFLICLLKQKLKQVMMSDIAPLFRKAQKYGQYELLRTSMKRRQ